jgi:branched-chain amino acid aminotransferase
MSEARYWFNGALLPAEAIGISPFDRGLLLGDGVFETIRAYDGRLFRLADHLARLEAGATVLDIPLPPGLGEAVAATLAANGWRDAVLRLTVTRGATPPDRGGLLLPTPPPPTVLITGRALTAPPYPARCYDPGLRAVWAGPPRNEHSPLSCCKTLNYGDQILLRQAAARAEADEGLQRNTAGAVVGASVANLFLVQAGTLITPALECGCLPGVTRALVLELAAMLGIPAVERVVLPEEVTGADELFLTNTLLEIAPVAILDDQPIGPRPGMGPITARLAAAFAAHHQGAAE